jgi:hypothetical protein
MLDVSAALAVKAVAAFQFMVNRADSAPVADRAATGVLSIVNIQVRVACPQNRAGAQTGFDKVQVVASSIA